VTATTTVGTYAITVAAGTLSAANYSFLFQNGTLTVTPAVLTVSATGTQTQGAASPTLTPIYSGFVNNESSSVLSGSPSLTTTVNASTPVGTYANAITVTQGTLSAANYSFLFQNGTFTVTPAATGTVSGTVYFDANGDGTLDNGESGQSGWVVTLHATSGGFPDQTYTTGASGSFTFSNLSPATYTLSETVQPSYRQTQPGLANNLSYTFTVGSGFTGGTFNFGNVVFAAPANLAISPATVSSATQAITNTGAVMLSGTVSQSGLTVALTDVTTGANLGQYPVSGTSFSIPLALAEGTHDIQAQAVDSGGESSQTSNLNVLVDLTPPTSYVNTLPTVQTSDTFTVPVTFSDPAGSNGATPSGVASVALWVAGNGGSYSLYQTLPANGATSGTLNFTFTGSDRTIYSFYSIAHDEAGNTENHTAGVAETSTYVPDLTPPLTHVTAASPAYSWSPFPSAVFSNQVASSYANGTFTLNWAGVDPDQPVGGSIASLSIYVQIDNNPVTLVGTFVPAGPTAVTYGGTPMRSTPGPPLSRPWRTAWRTPTTSGASAPTISFMPRPRPPRPMSPSPKPTAPSRWPPR
jgi:hypothetical protein